MSGGMLARLSYRIRNTPLVSVVRLYGTIAPSGRIGGGALNDASLAPLLERAFSAGRPVAVALAVNSPGGAPVQSALIAARIRRLAAEKRLPVIAFCEDVAASGGYWLAAAADEIYADESSIVGSIGVISASFGFHTLLERQGVERRVHTAGEAKSMLDPFQPEDAEDVARLKLIQGAIHDAFKAHVTARRGARLAEGRDLFTGQIWAGREAAELGLVDGIGHLVPKMKERFGDKVRFQVASPRRSLAQRLGLPGVAEVVSVAEERLQWARYGS
ncbi:MAG: S49 family peptidase [Pseudomonadota bacterium]